MKYRFISIVGVASISLLGCTKFAIPVDAAAESSADRAAESAVELGARDDVPDTAPGADATDATLTLGRTCQRDADCASAHCAAGICCDQACTGPCAQCSSAGQCQMPADDPACGTVTCPADTPCRDYATSITTDRCKAIGQCKLAADCTYLDSTAKTYCGLYQDQPGRAQFCDGKGSCVGPTVKCGGDTACAVSPGYCCASRGTTACLPEGATCAPTSGGSPSTCDETADCATGSVCCAISSPGGANTYCIQSCTSSVNVTAIQVCNPTIAGQCRTGTCQANSSGPPYNICM